MDPKDYEQMVINKLVAEFQENFYNKVGFVPIVITANQKKENDNKKIVSLDNLKEIVNAYRSEKAIKNDWTLESKDRHTDVVMLRQIFCYIAKKIGYYLKSIGAVIGNRDHTTVIHSVNVVTNMLSIKDPFYTMYYESILNDIIKTYGDEFTLLHTTKEKRDNTESTLHPVLL